jgi:hypothetical protein
MMTEITGDLKISGGIIGSMKEGGKKATNVSKT